MRIDISKINQNDFVCKITPTGDVLVTPSRTKHIWALCEIFLRSLLLDAEGQVLSSGFNKFFNLGENAEMDALFKKRFSENAVTFSEKVDGSLIVLDQFSDSEINLRTRGNYELGEFSEDVNQLLIKKYF